MVSLLASSSSQRSLSLLANSFFHRSLSSFAHLQNGSLQNPYNLNKFISFCAKSSLFSTGFQLHSTIIKLGFTSNVYICSALVDLYGKFGWIEDAHKVFDEMPERNSVTWNCLVSGYLNAGLPDYGVRLFVRMLREGMIATSFGVSTALVGCMQMGLSQLGVQIHGLGVKHGCSSNVVVGTSLIDFYAKCNSVNECTRVFNQMNEKNVVTWTAMVSGYAQNKLPTEAMVVFKEMNFMGYKPNYVTFNCLLSSFIGKEHIGHCKQIHCRVLYYGLASNTYIEITLLTAYADCGCSLEDFHQICLDVTLWDRISWNAVISGFSNLGCHEKALKCLFDMMQDGVGADYFTLATSLKSIGIVSASELGKQVHALGFKTGCLSNVCVQNGLVSMYGRCGLISDAKRMFLAMNEHDLISWNSLLSGLAHHGYSLEVVELFELMCKTGIQPDLNSFLSLLSACSHGGLVEKGLGYFRMLGKLGFHESHLSELYACVVDLLGRAGYVYEAEAFVNNMPIKPGLSVYKSLISACKLQGNIKIATRVSRRLLEMYPDEAATYVLMSSALASGGCWDEAEQVLKVMEDKGLRKSSGCSWIESVRL